MRLKLFILTCCLAFGLCFGSASLAYSPDKKNDKKHSAAWKAKHEKHSAAWKKKHSKHSAAWRAKHEKHDSAWKKEHSKKKK